MNTEVKNRTMDDGSAAIKNRMVTESKNKNKNTLPLYKVPDD